MKASPRVTLQRGREKSLRQRHPWVYSGAIARVEGAPQPGETVTLHAADGAFLATAAWSPASNIRARVWSFDPNAVIDPAFFAARVHAAVRALRNARREPHRLPASSRRIGWTAGLHRRPLRRRGGRAMPRGGCGTMERR